MTAVVALFSGFFRVGLFGFGGGPSMIPLMKTECLQAGWVSEDLFLEGLAAGNALPGPIALKMAWFVGWQHAGLGGALAALAGVTTPGVLLMALLGSLLLRHREHPWVAAGLRGAKAAVVGMLFWVAVDLAPGGARGAVAIGIAAAAFAALWWQVHPAVVMAAAMAIGVLVYG